MTRAEWLERRRTGIGGSDAAAVVGVSRWASPLSLYLEKIGEGEDREPTERMRWGNILQDVVGREWAMRSGATIHKGRFRRLAKPSYWIGNTDFEGTDAAGDPAVVEVKVSEYPGEWSGIDGGDDVPLPYYLQVQHYIELTGVAVGYLVVLLRGSELRSFRIGRDAEVIGQLGEAYADFWHSVETRTPPIPDGSEATAQALARMHPSDDGSEIVAMPETLPVIDLYLSARERIALAEKDKLTYENLLKDRMGPASRLLFPGGSISWKANRPSTKVGWQFIAEAYRRMLEAHGVAAEELDPFVTLYTVESPGARPFRVTLKDEE